MSEGVQCHKSEVSLGYVLSKERKEERKKKETIQVKQEAIEESA